MCKKIIVFTLCLLCFAFAKNWRDLIDYSQFKKGNVKMDNADPVAVFVKETKLAVVAKISGDFKDEEGKFGLFVANSCADIKRKNPSSVSGSYQIKIDSKNYNVYCNMDDNIDGGGWTLIAGLRNFSRSDAYEFLQHIYFNTSLNDTGTLSMDNGNIKTDIFEKLAGDKIMFTVGDDSLMYNLPKKSNFYSVLFEYDNDALATFEQEVYAKTPDKYKNEYGEIALQPIILGSIAKVYWWIK